MAKVALYIKTFMRNPCLFEVVESIRRHGQTLDYRIYVADDGEIDDDRARLYEALERDGHCVIRLPFDIGASAGRNAGLEHIDEPYVLRMDDDFVFTAETHVDRMMAILEARPEIGAVADLETQRHEGKGVAPGEISHGQGALEQYWSTLWKVPVDLNRLSYEQAGGVRFHRCGFTRNFLLIRRTLLDEIRWDPNLKIRGEHVDFMLQILRRSPWDLAFTPDSVHVHAGPAPAAQPEVYQEYRYRDGGYQDILNDKWGFRRIMVDRVGGSSSLRRRWVSAKAALRDRLNGRKADP